MHKNSKDLFDRYLTTAVPLRGLMLAKCKPGDFAIYRFGDAEVAVAVLRVIRAHGARRFDGVIGTARGESVQMLTRGRMEIGHLCETHIFNVPPLLDAAFIDEDDEQGSIERFVGVLDQQLAVLLTGKSDAGFHSLVGSLALMPVTARAVS